MTSDDDGEQPLSRAYNASAGLPKLRSGLRRIVLSATGSTLSLAARARRAARTMPGRDCRIRDQERQESGSVVPSVVGLVRCGERVEDGVTQRVRIGEVLRRKREGAGDLFAAVRYCIVPGYCNHEMTTTSHQLLTELLSGVYIVPRGGVKPFPQKCVGTYVRRGDGFEKVASHTYEGRLSRLLHGPPVTQPNERSQRQSEARTSQEHHSSRI